MREVRHSSLGQIIHGAHCKTGLPLTNSHNVRSAKLSFHIPHAGVMHGLAGYFEAILYGDVGLSIHPCRKEWVSKDMLSWFPLFFPFRVCFSSSPCDTLSEHVCFRNHCTCPATRNCRCGYGVLRTIDRCGTSGMRNRIFRLQTRRWPSRTTTTRLPRRGRPFQVRRHTSLSRVLS